MYGMSYGKKKKMQDGGNTNLVGSTVMKPMGKAKDTQAPQSYMEDQNRQKTMMYGGMAAKKERKPMNLGGTVKYFGNAYGPRKPKTVLS